MGCGSSTQKKDKKGKKSKEADKCGVGFDGKPVSDNASVSERAQERRRRSLAYSSNMSDGEDANPSGQPSAVQSPLLKHQRSLSWEAGDLNVSPPPETSGAPIFLDSSMVPEVFQPHNRMRETSSTSWSADMSGDASPRIVKPLDPPAVGGDLHDESSTSPSTSSPQVLPGTVVSDGDYDSDAPRPMMRVASILRRKPSSNSPATGSSAASPLAPVSPPGFGSSQERALGDSVTTAPPPPTVAEKECSLASSQTIESPTTQSPGASFSQGSASTVLLRDDGLRYRDQIGKKKKRRNRRKSNSFIFGGEDDDLYAEDGFMRWGLGANDEDERGAPSQRSRSPSPCEPESQPV